MLSTVHSLYRQCANVLGVREVREGDQPVPIPHDGPDVTELVIADLRERRRLGVDRYGTPLQPFNGRDPGLDLYQELLDAVQYRRQEIEEQRMTQTDTEIEFRSTMTVTLVNAMADDGGVVSAARVSTAGDKSRAMGAPVAEDSTEAKLIGFLMRERHGSPFEHSVMTFFVEAPIFVFRELMRHRMASYNEESGRYRQLRPVFYVPARTRLLQQIGRAGRYTFTAGTASQTALVEAAAKRGAVQAYAAYEAQLADGVAREVARMVLPLSIYSSAYVTMNARALMNFLSLRVQSDDATFPSYPQREIEMVAEQMEQLWAGLMPITHAAFEANGRVAP